MIETTISAGAVSLLVLEGIKYILRKWIIKNPEFDFDPKFYYIALPVLNVLLIPLLALIFVGQFEMPTDWTGFARLIIQTLIASLISVFGYDQGLKPLKEYSALYSEEKP